MRHFINLSVVACETRVPWSYCKFFYAYVFRCPESAIASQCLWLRLRRLTLKAKAQSILQLQLHAIFGQSILAAMFSDGLVAAVITPLYSDKSDLTSKTAWLALR